MAKNNKNSDRLTMIFVCAAGLWFVGRFAFGRIQSAVEQKQQNKTEQTVRDSLERAEKVRDVLMYDQQRIYE